jgi:putative ABC transport system permease protein
MKRRWILLFLRKSISQRKGRTVIASISITLAVAVITAMAGITIGINEKLGSELKAYGANIIVSSAESNYLDHDVADKILKIDNVTDAKGQVLGNVYIGDQSIEVIGLDINSLKESGWRLTGKWPEGKSVMLAGINLKKALDIDAGKKVLLSSPPERGDINKSRKIEFAVTGFIERGGPEDNAFLLSIADAWELTGLDNKLSTVLVRGRPGKLDNVVKEIRDVVPVASVKTFRQVAFAEESLLNKIQLLMALVTVVVLFASVISVASTMGANVFERREEIGIMMAIGARKNEISLFYAAEAVLIGLIGGSAGFVLGYISTQIISKGAFESYISMPFYVVLLSAAAGLIISLLASHFPVRDALKYSPAEILRGE